MHVETATCPQLANRRSGGPGSPHPQLEKRGVTALTMRWANPVRAVGAAIRVYIAKAGSSGDNTPALASFNIRLAAVVASRLGACINGNRAARGVLVNNAALHHKYNAPNRRDVFQRVAIERN